MHSVKAQCCSHGGSFLLLRAHDLHLRALRQLHNDPPGGLHLQRPDAQLPQQLLILRPAMQARESAHKSQK